MEEKEKKEKFDYLAFEADAIKQLQDGKKLEGKDRVFVPLIKRIVEAGLNGEMDGPISKPKDPNRRNGKNSKRVKTVFGAVAITTPRDRNSNFEPQHSRCNVLLPLPRHTKTGESRW